MCSAVRKLEPRRGLTEASRVAALVQSLSYGVEWSQIASDGGVGVLIVDGLGRVFFINSVAAAVYAKRPAREAIGSATTFAKKIRKMWN